jgi:hypothetical protein
MRKFLALLAVSGLAAGAAQAESYALVIGAGAYRSPELSLEGPRDDASRLSELLERKFGYLHANVRLLVDERATRANILAGLDWLAASARTGDQVLIYYSGQGTTSLDPEGVGPDANTGALIPTDVRISANRDAVLAQLIVGRRDLRPRLQALDNRGADTLVILDASFSGDSGRALAGASRSRFVSLPELGTAGGGPFGGRFTVLAGALLRGLGPKQRGARNRLGSGGAGRQMGAHL